MAKHGAFHCRNPFSISPHGLFELATATLQAALVSVEWFNRSKRFAMLGPLAAEDMCLWFSYIVEENTHMYMSIWAVDVCMYTYMKLYIYNCIVLARGFQKLHVYKQ